MQQLLLIGLAGAVGALTRYGLAGLVQNLAGSAFPWGTAVVNILGSFLFGVIWSLAETHLSFSAETRTIVLTGFMGSFTTFSTFMFETGALLRADQGPLALINLVLQISLGLLCLFIGLAVGRAL